MFFFLLFSVLSYKSVQYSINGIDFQFYNDIGHEIRDLEWYGPYFTNEVRAWSNTLVFGGVNVTFCYTDYILGGYLAFPYTGPGTDRTYINLAPHDLIYLSFTFWRVDSLDLGDGLRITIDSTIYNIIDMHHTNNLQSYCGNIWKESKIEVIIKLAHSSSSINIRVQNICNQPGDNESVGVRDFAIVLRNNTGSETNQIFAVGINLPPIATAINCQLDQFMSGTCQPCNPACKTCYGSSPSQCYRCNDSYYLIDGSCQPCHAECRTCIGPYRENCTSCFNPDVNFTTLLLSFPCFCQPGEYVYLNIHCSICPFPYIKAGFRCFDPCPNGLYYYKNGSCLHSCPYPFLNSSSYTALFCDFPCSGIDYYYYNTSCLGSCPYPFELRNVSIGSFCEFPCANNQYFYENRTCLSSCDPYLNLIDYTPGYMCKFPCNNDEFMFANYTCKNQCDYPFYSTNISIGGLCHFPCPLNKYFYSNNTCLSTCPSPYIMSNITLGVSCYFPCSMNQYYYQNGSCLSSCPFPWRVRNEITGIYCNFPCLLNNFYYSNDTCLPTCSQPYYHIDVSLGKYCHFNCSMAEYYFKNGSCLNVCPRPWISRNETTGAFCDFPCSQNQYFYSNGSCLNSCNYPFYKNNISLESYCIFPCPSSQYYMTGGGCNITCNYPLKIRNESAAIYCDFPCRRGEFYYANESCLKKCTYPFLATNHSYGSVCNFKCRKSQYYFAHNDSCGKVCSGDFETQIQSVGSFCNFPCNSNDYLFSNKTCLNSCPYPFTSRNYSYGRYCDFPCSLNYYYHTNDDACKDSCLPPLLKIDLSVGTICLTPQAQYSFKKLASMIDSLLTGTIAATAPCLLAGADPTTAVAFMSLLQGFYFLLFYNVNYPDNVIAILGSFKVAKLDFLPKPLSWVLDKIPNSTSPARFHENGYTGFFIDSTSNSLVAFIIYTTIFIYGLGLGKSLRLNSWANKIARWFYFKMNKSLTLRLFLMQFMELSICSILQIFEIDFHNSLMATSSLLALIFFMITYSYPVFVYKLLKRKNIKYKEIREYEPIIEDYDISRKWCLRFGLILISRKSLHCAGLVLLYYVPIIQVCFPWMLNLIILYCYLKLKPHHRRFLNVFETLNEIGFIILHSNILLLAYLDLSGDFNVEKRDDIGWIMIAVMSGILIFGLINIWIENIRVGIGFFKKYRALYRNNKSELRRIKRRLRKNQKKKERMIRLVKR